MFAARSHRARVLRTTAALLTAFSIVACEGESDPSGPDNNTTLPGLNEVVTAGPLNASATDTLIYFNLASNTLVTSTQDWDVAFRRYEVRLNGGVSGTKGVLGYSVDNNKTATDAQVLAFTVANTLATFSAYAGAQVPADNAFFSDRLEENNVAYVNFAGAPSANTAAYWKVKTAAGGYALMHVTAIAYNQTGSLTSITVESRLQGGATLGAAQQVTVPITGAPVAISLIANSAVTALACNWDLQVNPQTFAMTTNATCSAGTFPGPTSPTFATATTASDAAQYGAFLSAMVGPVPNSVTDKSAPFRYNLQNDNRLSPSFNMYLVKVGVNVYKLQLINYYSDAGGSGYPTIRYARIR